jgi:glycosyltransferase involved in cell wall biosynthesis
MEGLVRSYLDRYRFIGIADYLGLPHTGEASEKSARLPHEFRDGIETSAECRPLMPAPSQIPISIVVPCFNEALILRYLANTLKSVETALSPCYDLRYIFVDDGSRDATWSSLQTLFGRRPDCLLLQHATNRGVASAILTGIKHAETEIVCSIDCDCTYDPHQLRSLIPKLTEGVDMVTASPYHAEGVVRNVPRWRLFLSKSLSFLYRFVLHHRLATYTSCFRVYRRSAVSGLQVRGGFLGVAEMLGLLDLEGRIVECPAVLKAGCSAAPK